MPRVTAYKVRCDRCEMVSINGTPCHEHGCPNMGATWNPEEQTWVRYFECGECGDDVRQGEQCDCSTIDWEPDMNEEE